VRRASMNGRRWALEGGIGRAGSRRRMHVAPSRAETSRVPLRVRVRVRESMVMQYTDRYVYYKR